MMRSRFSAIGLAIALATVALGGQTPTCSQLWTAVNTAAATEKTATSVLATNKRPTSAQLTAIRTAQTNLANAQTTFQSAKCVVPDPVVTPTPTPTPVPVPSGTLVQASNMVYRGYIDVPATGFAYGGRALSYYAPNNSLFIATNSKSVAEISIPAFGGRAAFLRQLVDASEGRTVGSSSDDRIGGTLPYGNVLVFTKYIYYDANGEQTQSHFTRPLDLSISGQVVGPVRVGPMGAGFYSGGMALVPTELQAALGGPAVTGNCCLNVVSRTSRGPALFAFDPAALGTKPAIPLVYYPGDHPTLGTWESRTPGEFYGMSDEMHGVVIPKGYASVLFFSRHGDTACYGGAECNDPTDANQGVHGYPYHSVVLAYRVADFDQVRQGLKQPWDVIPYAKWELPELNGSIIYGAAYDEAGQRVFVSQYKGSDPNPRIHVYQLTP